MASPAKEASPVAAAHRPVRMREVAELAGVGTMTVSRVLNGTAHVAEETSRRVAEAIEQLHYLPNPVARALRGSSSHTIGVLLPYLHDPFFATCAHAVNAVAQQLGYSMILTTTNEDPGAELEEIRQMVRRQVDGLIVIPAHRPKRSARTEAATLATLAALGSIPVVTLDRPMPEADFDRVEVENEAGGALGADHLIAHGYRDICFLGLTRDLHTMQLRHKGYQRAMTRAGLAATAHFSCDSQASVTALMRTMFAGSSPPRALFTANGLVTRYALKALDELGISLPSQVAVVGFDDLELSDLLASPLTVLRQPTRELGREAAELLFYRLAKGAQREAKYTRVLPVELVVRESCGCVAPAFRPNSRVEGGSEDEDARQAGGRSASA